MKKSFKLKFDKLSSKPARVIIDAVHKAEKKRVGELKVYDLIFDGNQPMQTVRGVYLFYSSNNKKCLYVGKNSKKQFVERIPDHFALGEDSWMNYLLKRMKETKGLPNIEQAAKKAKNCRLLLIQVGDREYIGKLEKFFKICLEPEFNSYSEKSRNRRIKIDLDKSLIDVLNQL